MSDFLKNITYWLARVIFAIVSLFVFQSSIIPVFANSINFEQGCRSGISKIFSCDVNAVGLNAIIYLVEGDVTNFGISAASILPGGDILKAGKYAAAGVGIVGKVVKNAKKAEKTAKALKLLGTAGDNLLNAVTNPKLKNIVKNLYKKTAKIGNGSSMDAVRLEKLTGQSVGGKFHSQKLIESRNGLLKLWKNRDTLSGSDRKVIKELLINIQDALSN